MANAVAKTNVPVRLAAMDKGYHGHNAVLLGTDVLMPGHPPEERPRHFRGVDAFAAEEAAAA